MRFLEIDQTSCSSIKCHQRRYACILSHLHRYQRSKVFGATPGLGGVIGGATLLTGITDENPIKNIFTGEHLVAGQGGIIGVIFAVWLLSLVEKRLHKVVPNSIDIIVTPTISLLIIGLLTIFIIMPLLDLSQMDLST